MGQILPNGELQLTDEECEKLKLPPNSVVPVENVEDFQAKLQTMYDDDVRKLARQIGTTPEEEPYPGTAPEQIFRLIAAFPRLSVVTASPPPPGYYEDVKRLGLNDQTLISNRWPLRRQPCTASLPSSALPTRASRPRRRQQARGG